MTDTMNDKNLTRNKLRQLIELAKGHVPPEQTPPDTTPYDWQQPHHFSSEQLVALDAFVKKLAEQTAETFDSLRQGNFETTLTSTTQHFACAIAKAIPTEQPEHYFLPFATTDNNLC